MTTAINTLQTVRTGGGEKPQWVRRLWDAVAAKMPKLACEINYLRRYHRWERDLWAIPEAFAKGEVAIDVGTNEGIFSRWMAKHASAVHSFECNPDLIERLRRFLPRKCQIHACALSDRKGKMSLRFDPENTGIGTIEARNLLDRNPGIRSIKEVEVEVETLDEFEFSSVGFVKIDVEGHELSVLKGASNLIARELPAILIEIEERHCPGNLAAVPAWLAAYGYRPYIFDEGGKFRKTDRLEGLAEKGINNFWFFPEGKL